MIMASFKIMDNGGKLRYIIEEIGNFHLKEKGLEFLKSIILDNQEKRGFLSKAFLTEENMPQIDFYLAKKKNKKWMFVNEPIPLNIVSEKIGLFKDNTLNMDLANNLELIYVYKGKQSGYCTAFVFGNNAYCVHIIKSGYRSDDFYAEKIEDEEDFVKDKNSLPSFAAFINENLGGRPEFATDDSVADVLYYIGSEHGDDAAETWMDVCVRLPTIDKSRMEEDDDEGRSKFYIQRKAGFGKQIVLIDIFYSSLMQLPGKIEEFDSELYGELIMQTNAFIVWEKIASLGNAGWDDFEGDEQRLDDLVEVFNSRLDEFYKIIPSLTKENAKEAIKSIIKQHPIKKQIRKKRKIAGIAYRKIE